MADWLEQRGKDRVELDELLGYHLEQAARYAAELGQGDAALAERAAEHLASAGRRALWRGDNHAAAGLIEHALALTRPTPFDVRLELDLARALLFSDSERAAAVADAAAERAQLAGDEAGEAVARVVAAHSRQSITADPDGLEALARAALPLLEQKEDHASLVRVWSALSSGVAQLRGRSEEQAFAAEQALRHSRLAGDRHTSLFGLEAALVWGPRPADEALRTLDSLLPQNPQPGQLLTRAELLAMLGRLDEAWALAGKARARAQEVMGPDARLDNLAEIAMFAGDYATAVEYLRRFCDILEELGQGSFLSTYAPLLGRALCALGRYDEAAPLARLGCELGDEQDATAQALWRQTQALVHAARGEHVEAERLAREAVAIADRSDGLNSQGDALCDLAEALAAAGKTDEAAETFEQALERYGRKKNLALVAQVKPKLEELRKTAPGTSHTGSR
jgi:tetratricopeptide (TPR) repeat protein